MENLESLLEQHPFVKGLRKEHVRLLSGCTANARFDEGKFIFRENQVAEHFYILREGKVALEIYAPDRGPIVIDTLGADDILGWSWLIPPYHWKFDARVIEGTRALVLDGKCLRKKCEDDHDLGYELLKRFASIVEQRLEATRIQLLDIYGITS